MTTSPNLTIGEHDIEADVYHADPCPSPSLSSTIAKLVNQCPLKAFLAHPKLNPNFIAEDSSDTMDFGTLGHALLLGKGAKIDICSKEDWRTDFAKGMRADSKAAGRICVLQKIYDKGEALRKGAMHWMKQLGILDDFQKAAKEHTFIWRDDENYMRSMIDATYVDHGVATGQIFDVKITNDASPGACERRISDMCYSLQAHFQQEALKSIHREIGLHIEGRIKHLFLFIESEYPFMVTPMDLSGELAAIGRSQYNRARNTWKRCIAANRWPTYCAGVVTASAKPWDSQREMEAGGMGERIQ